MEAINPRGSIPAEQLFVETALGFLKPGGILGIVLPDGILNNPGLKFIRSWLMKRSRIVATVDLPKETFAANGGVNNPSVLIVQKFNHQEVKNANAGIYDATDNVFMATPRTAGIDKRGKSIFLRQADGQEILDDHDDRVKDDEVSLVPESFLEWYKLQKPIII
jgi:type I restriction enzyme M protein